VVHFFAHSKLLANIKIKHIDPLKGDI